ncbi:MAG: DUF58 domain-containing protein [Alphaproteobacteria bacterium]|nr:DUF58 domain-containing protein [Alphaproteobacteria bacterium]
MLDRLKTFFHKQATDPTSSFQEEGDGVHMSLPELLAQKRFVPLLSFDSLGFSKAEGLGLHRSPFRGRGMEFDEVRAYHQGDDIRLIDWRVTARTGKAHTKLYREERDRPVLFLADFRPRMHFGTRKAFKSVIAARVLAALAWASREHGDKIGAIVLSAAHYFKIAPHRQLRRLMEVFNAAVVAANDEDKSKGISLDDALAELRRVSKNGGRVYIISDFYGFDEECKKHLTYISRHCDVVCVQIFDPLEEVPPPPGAYRISDGHRIVTIYTDDEKWREEYEKMFVEPRRDLKTFCESRHIIYIGLRTDQDMIQTVRRGVLTAGEK